MTLYTKPASDTPFSKLPPDEDDGSEYEGQNDRVTSFEAQNINTGVWDLDG